MKTTINYLITLAIFSVIIFTGNVNANENKVKASGHEAIVETSLTIENWMTDQSVWNVKTKANFASEAEAELEMESWMTDENAWGVSFSGSIENEDHLILENWMTNDSYWKI